MIREIVTKAECTAARDAALKCYMTVPSQNSLLSRAGDLLSNRRVALHEFDLLSAEISEYMESAKPALEETRKRAWTEKVHMHFVASAPQRSRPFVWLGKEELIASHCVQRIVDSNFHLLQKVRGSIKLAQTVFSKRLTFWNLLPVENILTETDIHAECEAAIKNLKTDMLTDSCNE
jgi:hypothetical protein